MRAGDKQVRAVTKTSMPAETLSKVVEQTIDSPNRVMVDDSSYAKCVVGLPDLKVSFTLMLLGLIKKRNSNT